MSRTLFYTAIAVVFCGFVCVACAKPEKAKELVDPAEAAKDPDFKIQGEYVGEGVWAGEAKVKAGAQVIALSQGKFAVVVTKGGLPGNGWKREDASFNLTGSTEGNATTLTGKEASGKIEGDKMTLADADGKMKLELKRTERHSSTEGQKAPEGAKILFDGTTADTFVSSHGKAVLLPSKNLLSDATTKDKFGDFTLHLEFRLSYKPAARGQDRSNSGVYLHDCYEIQVLDSFGLEGKDDECGGFYQLRKPDVNMCFPPMTWQTYDVKFIAPKYDGNKKIANAKVEVRHNGVVIHPEFELAHNTPGRQNEGPAPRPFYLQGHGNHVEFRNIWMVEGNPFEKK
jgi:hypothetical protein